MKIRNAIKHFNLITHHKWVVFKLCCRVGQPWRGLVHDLSKYSPTEFRESVKYYVGTYSPITGAKKDKGYSEAWLHHKGRNKHHFEYWIDYQAPEVTPIIPYQYAVEMVCDKLAAGIVYEGKNWTKEFELSYWEKREKNRIEMNPKMKEFVTVVMTEVAKNGLEQTLTRKNMKEWYKKYVNPIQS
ncbi:MAG: catalase [Clostridia bacterium]|nr:catalase [Clostridia bacterium]